MLRLGRPSGFALLGVFRLDGLFDVGSFFLGGDVANGTEHLLGAGQADRLVIVGEFAVFAKPIHEGNGELFGDGEGLETVLGEVSAANAAVRLDGLLKGFFEEAFLFRGEGLGRLRLFLGGEPIGAGGAGGGIGVCHLSILSSGFACFPWFGQAVS